MVSSEIEKIEILRGPQGLMYGADAGGVVNIRTRSGSQDFKSQLSMEVGRYDSQAVDVYVSGGSERSDAFVSVSDTRTEGFDLNSATITNPENDGYENTTIHTKFGWNLSEQVRAQLVVRDTQSLNEYDKCVLDKILAYKEGLKLKVEEGAKQMKK
jgi:vitamin B12 transporter